MKAFIPEAKLSKKARKELAKQKRRLWEADPRMKVIESKKLYSRKRNAHDRYDDSGMSVLFCV